MKTRLVFALVLAAGCATRPVPGTYEVIQPAASDSGERHIRVTLKEGGEAAVSTAFASRPSRSLAFGTWARAEGRIVVALERERMVFRHAGDQLIAQEWDRTVWGEAGPGVLFRVFR